MAFDKINIRDTDLLTKCILLIFLLSLIPGITAPIAIFLWNKSYYDYWRPLYSLCIVTYMTSIWFCINCILGCFLILVKTTSKLIAALFSISLFAVIAGTVYCVIASQISEITLTNPDNYFVHALTDYFSEHEDVPKWLHTMQENEKCCGISGPKDWLEFIYPPDKPGIEDVPISCCIVKALGCNFILADLTYQAELSKWIYTKGCQNSIKGMIQGFMNYIMYWSIPISILSFLLITMFWYEVTKFSNGSLPLSEQCTAENSLIDVEDILKRDYSYDSAHDEFNYGPVTGNLEEPVPRPLQSVKNVRFYNANTNNLPNVSTAPRKSILASSKSSSVTNMETTTTRRGAMF